MAHVTVDEVQAWLEPTKLTLGSLDSELEDSIATQVISRIAQAYDTSSWLGHSTTPKLVLKIIAMSVAAEYYLRAFSETPDPGNDYAIRLLASASMMIDGIIAGTIPLTDVLTGVSTATFPGFYPTDISSSQTPTSDDMSLGPNKFSMGVIW